MRPSLPVVHSPASQPTAVLYDWPGQPRRKLEIPLNSDEWFTWLAQECSFKFIYYKQGGHSVNVTVRPEKRGQRTTAEHEHRHCDFAVDGRLRLHRHNYEQHKRGDPFAGLAIDLGTTRVVLRILDLSYWVEGFFF